MPDNPLPLSYRNEVLDALIKLLQAGESCSVVGVGSSGKSNLARYLARADVRLRYFEWEAAQTIVLYLNCKPFALHPPHDFYLHILERLIAALAELDGAFTALVPEITTLLKESESNPPVLAKRNLDRAIASAFQRDAKRLIFLLDDCDDILGKASPIFFSDLRSMRDNHKLQVVFLTTTRRELAFLRTDASEYEEFFELFSAPGHTFPLPMYTEADSGDMVRRLAARQQPAREISAAQIRRIYELSGGHAGLVRTIFFATLQSLDVMAPDILNQLCDQADVESECRKVWDSLESEERDDLRRIIARAQPTPEGLRRLIRRGLVRFRVGAEPECVSPLLAQFVSRAPVAVRAAPSPLELTGREGEVRAYGQLISGLTRPEYDLLRYLMFKRGQTCTHAELLEVMFVAERTDPAARLRTPPPERVMQYLANLKSKLGAAGALIQVTGDGYRLV